jgi:hypothetical protein
MARTARRRHQERPESWTFAQKPAVAVAVRIGTRSRAFIAARAALEIEDEHLLALEKTLGEIRTKQRLRRLLLLV